MKGGNQKGQDEQIVKSKVVDVSYEKIALEGLKCKRKANISE